MNYDIVRSSGYDFSEVCHDTWMLDFKDSTEIYSSFKELVMHMCINLDFKVKEIELAVSLMLSENNNSAHFGVNKTFIYTFDKDLSFALKKVS